MRWALLPAPLLLACGSSVPICPELEQGTLVFTFQAVNPPPATTCQFLVDQIDAALAATPPGTLPRARFTATVSWRATAANPADGAALCVQAPLAQDKLGWHVGDDLHFPGLATTSAAGSLPNCPCRVDLVESLLGTLDRGPDGGITGFSGTLSTVVARNPGDEAPAGTCYPAHDAAVASGAVATDGCPPGAGSCDANYAWPPP